MLYFLIETYHVTIILEDHSGNKYFNASCVILGRIQNCLFFILSTTICNLNGFCQIKYIDTEQTDRLAVMPGIPIYDLSKPHRYP